MKKLWTIIMCFALTTLAGCGNQPLQKDNGTLNPAEMVVEHYLESSVENNWPEALKDLTGEALVEATINKDRVTNKGKIVSKKFSSRFITENTAEVTVDFTKATGSIIDRLAYRFLLIKSETGWKIYKTEWGSYIHGDLKPGQMLSEAEKVIRQYVELPVPEKRSKDYIYLAGKLLDDSMKSKLLPQDNGKDTKTTEKVNSVECLGVTDDYAVARVNSEITRDGKNYSVDSIIDMVNVNGTWKIARKDIASIKGV